MKTAYIIALLLVTSLAVEKTNKKKDFLCTNKEAKTSMVFTEEGDVIGEWGKFECDMEWK